MAIFGHDPRLQLGRQRSLSSVLRGGFLGLQRMYRRFRGFAPGIAHFLASLVVRAFFNPAQQQRQRDACRNQRQQNHPGGDEDQQVTLGKRIRAHQHRHRHHAGQRYCTAHTADSQQPAGARGRDLRQLALAAQAAQQHR
ncbi:hypothetical protein D3C87_1228390 [compost metagenome]